jgi:glutamate---cysteine ligase / carboxylate-amine ligase
MSLATLPLPTAPPAKSHGFGASTPFRVGVEEELFLVDPHSLRDAGPIDGLLDGRPASVGAVLGEICDGVVELVTPVCDSAAGACAALRELRAGVLASGAGTLLGVGVHPTADFGDVCHRRGARYDAISASTRSLLRQSAYCGVHIHVGLPDPETAITAYNGMRKWVPLLQALSANSPFWHGHDSGLASTRTVLCHSVPRTGLPRAFRDWADYEETVDELLAAADLRDEGAIWWDLRPHPRLGTLEVRVLDAQSSLADLEALVALVHCLVVHEATLPDPASPSTEVLSEATFRALRDGLDATLSLGGPMRPVREHAVHAFHLAQGYVERLGCKLGIGQITRLLAQGNGAVRQRYAYERGGMTGVLEHLARETSEGAHRPSAQGAAA